ncbi:MAG: hypothetical protein KDK50_01965 [Chlamydiia bacterium]|nr:hypothetical protein [Chlamydiia bacterium]
MHEGVLIGADDKCEKLLSWWHSYYKNHNDRPVAILNFGLSPWGLAQAKKIGVVIDATTSPSIKVKCKHRYARYIAGACLKRITHMKRSPFETTLWMDIDCIVRCNINHLFAYADHPSGFAAAHTSESGNSFEPNKFNGGIHVVKKTSTIYDFWISEIQKNAQHFDLDDLILSRAIHEHCIEINWFPNEYNTDASYAKIKHMHGRHNKYRLFSDPNYRHFWHPPFEHEASDDFGIVLHCDPSTEQFIDWWTINYRMYNNFPVSINTNPFAKSLHLTPCHIVQGHLTPKTQIHNFQDRNVFLPFVKIIHYSGEEGKLALLAEIMIGSTIHKELSAP